MLNNILCPIDFTTFSHHALERAVGIARSYGAAVTGIYVAETHAPSAGQTGRSEWTTEEVTRMQAQVLKKLREVNAPSPRAVARLGTPSLEIVKLAASLPADLIVMPLHGRTGCAHGTCGSVTQEVLGHAHTPVIAVPDTSGSPAETSNGGFRRILCGINFSPASLKALRYAADLAVAGTADLLVTHVLSADEVSNPIARDPDSTDSQSPRAIWRRRLHEAAHSDLSPGLHVEDRLRVGDPATELLQLANDEQCDLIVIGGHRGNPHECVMNDIVTRSRCPVLTVRVAR
jgi:nucleotide-binding universal stress UspA family protein